MSVRIYIVFKNYKYATVIAEDTVLVAVSLRFQAHQHELLLPQYQYRYSTTHTVIPQQQEAGRRGRRTCVRTSIHVRAYPYVHVARYSLVRMLPRTTIPRTTKLIISYTRVG